MASNALKESEVTPVSVPVVKIKEITEILPPPYDLIKLDIEGGGVAIFLNFYNELLKETHYLLLEWHSWHSGGGGVEQIREKIYSLGFKILKESIPVAVTKEGRQVGLLLAENGGFSQLCI